jgi:translation initiation factor SUI1
LDFFGEAEIHLKIMLIGRRKMTIVQGLDPNDKILSSMKKKFCCAGNIVNKEIRLSGDQRQNVCDYLVKSGLNNIVMHGV